MKGNEKVIEQLNARLAEELAAINQYFLHAEMCENWRYESLKAEIKKRSIMEMRHAEKLIERSDLDRLFTSGLVHHTLQAGGWSGIERAVTGASRFVRRLFGWNRQSTVSSGGPRWDQRQVSYAASRWTRQLVRLTDPRQVVARRRANYARLATRLRSEIDVPFPEQPASVLLGLLPAGLGVPWWLCMLAGAAAVVAALRVFGVSTVSPGM